MGWCLRGGVEEGWASAVSENVQYVFAVSDVGGLEWWYFGEGEIYKVDYGCCCHGVSGYAVRLGRRYVLVRWFLLEIRYICGIYRVVD